MLLKTRTLKVAHLSVGRALIVLTVPQHATLPVAKQNTTKGLGSATSDLFSSTQIYVCVYVCVDDVDCWLWVISTSLRVNGPLRWGFVGDVFLCRHWGLITNNSCLTFSQVYVWNAADVCRAAGRIVSGGSMSHHLQPVSHWFEMLWFIPPTLEQCPPAIVGVQTENSTDF